MNRTITTAAALVAAGTVATPEAPASAHAIAGARVFPVTLTMDDPGVADEASFPTFSWQRSAGPSNQYNLQWEFDKTITPTTALIYNQGYSWLQSSGAKTQTGFENAVITGKWQAYVSAEHEFLLSGGVQNELNGNQHTQSIGGDAYGSVSPTLYVGKGMGDLPVDALRPFAVTGELAYAIPYRRLNTAGDNSGSPPIWNAGVSIQYSLSYLQSQVKDYGFPEFVNRLIPILGDNVEHAGGWSRLRLALAAHLRARRDLSRRYVPVRHRGVDPRQPGDRPERGGHRPASLLLRRHLSQQHRPAVVPLIRPARRGAFVIAPGLAQRWA
jgi:hypothetical protein